jgi:hypothetical protein
MSSRAGTSSIPESPQSLPPIFREKAEKQKPAQGFPERAFLKN